MADTCRLPRRFHMPALMLAIAVGRKVADVLCSLEAELRQGAAKLVRRNL